MQRLLNFLIALDQLFWVVFTLGKGYPDETISAAAWRMYIQNKRMGMLLVPIIDELFMWSGKDHCKNSYESELNRKQLPDYYKVKEG